MLDTSQIRQHIRKLRNSLPSNLKKQADLQILNKVKALSFMTYANNIALFLSFDGEINTAPIIEHLWQIKKNVLVPIIHPFNSKQLLFVKLTPNSKMTTNCFGIKEPKLALNNLIPASKLDLIFTPLVAYDKNNHRIGMGGGFYDRLFNNDKLHSIKKIGLAYRLQKVKKITPNSWDVKLDDVISDDITPCYPF